MFYREKEVKEILTRLSAENFNQRLLAMFGLTKEEADMTDPQWSKIGFDGKENRLGWSLEKVKWVLEHSETVKQALDDAEAIRDQYKNVIFCGMGGSGLSVEVVKSTFGEKDTKIYSLRTTDPAAIADILDKIKEGETSLEDALKNTLIIPISKSGTTQETVSHKKYFEDLYKKFNLDISGHIWVITDKGSPFDTGEFVQRGIQLNGKGDIGGRFTSPTTNIFLLPLAIVAPERVLPILEITKEMNSLEDILNDKFLKIAAFLYDMAKELGKDKLTILVPEELKDLPIWFEQLLEESLGKDGKGITLFYGESLNPEVLRSVSTNDRVFLRINLGRKKTKQVLWEHLAAKRYPIAELNLRDINDIGGLMLGMQRIVAAVAYLWDINFVNQPAVEGYKKETKEVMKSGAKVTIPETEDAADFLSLRIYYAPLIKAGILTREDIDKELGKFNLSLGQAYAADVYAAILNLLKDRFEAKEIISYGRMPLAAKKVLENFRYELFTSLLKKPAKLGEGPDKNHSYHQNIEGGRDMWFSLYLMPLKIRQPEALTYDDNLIKAQTLGTVNSLVNKGRKVLLLTIDTDNEADITRQLQDFFVKIEARLAGF
ncbi:MAG: hypothetical protein ABIG56_04200 [Candidatus Omnitrophota bacterium]